MFFLLFYKTCFNVFLFYVCIFYFKNIYNTDLAQRTMIKCIVLAKIGLFDKFIARYA